MYYPGAEGRICTCDWIVLLNCHHKGNAAVRGAVDGRGETTSQQRWSTALVGKDATYGPATDKVVQETAIAEESLVRTKGQRIRASQMEVLRISYALGM